MAASGPELPRYHIHNFDIGDDDIQARIKQHGVRFILYVSLASFRNSPSETARYQKIWEMIDKNETHDPEVWDYIAHIIEPFVPRIDELASLIVPSGRLTMKDLDAEKFYDLVLIAVDDKLLVGTVKESAPEDEKDDALLSPNEVCFARGLDAPFPILGLSDVEIPYEDPKLVFMDPQNRVLVDGHQYYFRRCHYYDITSSEIAKHTLIANSGLSVDELRCVRLFAIIEDKGGYIHGLLYHWIEAKLPLSLAIKAAVLGPSINQLRQKWADQIRATVTKMHELGVIWGDVKANNVLIDNNNNDAWVIDLEGGTSQGWVDAENEGMLQGDTQGMERLMDFIFNDDSPLRYREELDDYEIMD